MKNIITTGKKKTAVARVVLKKGSGKIFINEKSIDVYEPKILREWILEPIYLAKEVVGDKLNEIDIYANVSGGGISGQAQAVRTAIGKALLKYFGEDKLKELFANYDRSLYVDDSRRKEPKKDTRRGARARYQTSYR